MFSIKARNQGVALVPSIDTVNLDDEEKIFASRIDGDWYCYSKRMSAK